MIQITAELIFDPEKTFYQQTNEVQQWITDQTKTDPIGQEIEQDGIFSRPKNQYWVWGDIKIHKFYEYTYPVNHRANQALSNFIVSITNL